MRNEGGGFDEIDEEVAAVLAFVLSHTTFLALRMTKRGDARKSYASHQSLVTGS